MRIFPKRTRRPDSGTAEHAPPPGMRPAPSAQAAAPTSAAQVSAAAGKLAALTTRVGLPDAEALSQSEATLVIDPYARAVAGTYEQALPAAGDVIGGAADLAAELGRKKAQLAAAIRLYAAAAQFGGSLRGTRQLYGAALLKLVRQLVRRVRALLEDERISRKERQKLQSDAAELLELDDRLREGRAAATRATRAKKAEVTRAVGEVERQEQLFRTLLAFNRGEPVPPEQAAEAARAYDSLAGPAAERDPAPAGSDKRRRGR